MVSIVGQHRSFNIGIKCTKESLKNGMGARASSLPVLKWSCLSPRTIFSSSSSLLLTITIHPNSSSKWIKKLKVSNISLSFHRVFDL